MCSDSKTPAKSTDSRNITRVLTFHKLLKRPTFGATNYSPRRFGALLSRLKADSYEFSSLDEVRNSAGKKLVITFDDGYAHLESALPAFIEKYDLKPIVFVPTAYLGKVNTWDYSSLFFTDVHLDREGIKALSQLGVEFGAHGHTHRPLTRLSDKALREELSLSRKILEDITGQPVRLLSYPFGRYDRRITDAAQSCGYSHGFTMTFPEKRDDNLAMGRYPVYFYDTPFSVRQKLAGGRLYRFERLKAAATNRLSCGTGFYYHLIGKRRQS